MASLTVTGLTEYQKAVKDLGEASKRIIRMSIYDGAKVIADAVRARINNIPAIRDIEALTAWVQNIRTAMTESQKQGLLDGMTLTKMKDSDGETYTKLTWVGYNDTKTKSYPKGQPNIMIAGSMENGTSVRRKQPFIRPTVNAMKAAVLKAMEQTADAEIKKIMGE